MHPCRWRGCKNIKGQSWRWIKNLPVQPAPGASGSSLAKLAIFFATSNFDLKYFCNLLAYKNEQYLIWKIWFISIWSQKFKAVVWFLTYVMFAQSTPTSYHTKANGCIFFTGVYVSNTKKCRNRAFIITTDHSILLINVLLRTATWGINLLLSVV